MKLFSLVLSLLFPIYASATIYYAGVAESGGEFGVYSANAKNGTGLPGTFGETYAFLNASTVPIWVEQNKINTFRVAFLLERMCPPKYGLGRKFNETYYNHYAQAIKAITEGGGYAILDPHNYMRYNDPSQQPSTGSVIGNTSDPAAASTEQFRHFWNELAGRFKSNKKVIFAIMNEPHDMPTSLVLQNDQAAIDGIRASGARQLILAPGNAYTGGHSWLQNADGDAPSGDYMYKLKDPLENTAIDIHEYFDYNFSGQHQVCNQSFPANMAGVTAWLKQHSLKAMVTEFGVDNNTVCLEYVRQAIEYMSANDECESYYIGWTYWAAGPIWGNAAPCCNDGAALGSVEPDSVAAYGYPSLYDTVWLPAIAPQVKKITTLQKSGISSIHGPAGYS